MRSFAILIFCTMVLGAAATAIGDAGGTGDEACGIGPNLGEMLDVLDGNREASPRLLELLEKANVELEDDMDIFVVVTFDENDVKYCRGRLEETGLVHQHLNILPMSGVIAKAGEIKEMSKWPGVRSVYWNAPLKYHLHESADTVDVRPVWETYGEMGANVAVAVIDSGVDATHPDLLYGRNVIQSVGVYGGMDMGLPVVVQEDVPMTDSLGHGTHCCGIIGSVGRGTTGYDPTETVEDPVWHNKFRGMAPECKIVSFGAMTVGLSIYEVTLGFDYVLENRERYDIRVVSNSWGDSGEFDPQDPVCIATMECYKQGMLVVFAAGNAGPGAGTMNPYSVAPWVMAIAAGTKDKHLADFSSRGTNLPYDHPDITAPGVAIIAPKSRFGALQALSAGQGPYPPEPGGLADTSVHYQYMSGTSMATPHISGIAALLFSANPDLSPDQVMDILTYTAGDVQGIPREEIWHMGAGYVNAHEAYLLAMNTTGNMNEFLNGTYKYASGGTDLDPEYEIDCVNVGYDWWPVEEKPAVQEIAPEEEKSWLPGFGAAAALAAAIGLVLLLSKRRREK